MKLNPSPKIFENYKCDYPKNTIKKIEQGFEKLGLKLSYDEKFVKSLDSSIFSGYGLIDTLGFTQNGKSTSSLLSKASAYAELTERFSTGFILIRVPIPKKTYKYRKLLNDLTERSFLKGHMNVHSHESTNFENINKYFHKKISKKEYEVLKKRGLFSTLVDAYSLINEIYIKVPVHFIESKSTSNGLGSGNTYEEAIAQASFEIFERYAANKIFSEEIVCPTIDVKSIKNKKVQKYIEMFKSLNIETIIKDFTFRNKLPVIGVLFVNHNIENDKNKLKKDQYYKRIDVGSHIDINEAIIRCFTEYLQNVDTVELIERKQCDTLYYSWTEDLGKKYIGLDDKFKHFTREYSFHGDFSFLEKGEIVSLEDLESYENNDALDDVKSIINTCKENSWDILIVDYTHKVLQFPTVRVIIPPISTDFDHFTRECIKIESFEGRFNYFYGIKNFYRYIMDDNWLKEKNQIKTLIKNIEEYLSKELEYYQFYLTRENNFHQLINLFHIIPFLLLALGNYSEAKKYFEVLLKINPHPPIETSFFRSLYLTKYNPSIYETYIKIINNCIEKKYEINFDLKSNPFELEKTTDELEKMYLPLLENINKSFK